MVLAEHGLAIMRDAAGQTLTGRDLATGDERWRLRLRKPATRVSRAGDVLLVRAGDGTLSGVDFASGVRAAGERVIVTIGGRDDVVAA